MQSEVMGARMAGWKLLENTSSSAREKDPPDGREILDAGQAGSELWRGKKENKARLPWLKRSSGREQDVQWRLLMTFHFLMNSLLGHPY